MLLGMATSSAWAGNDNAKVPADSLHTYQLQTVVVASTRAGNKTPMAFQNVSRKELQSVNFGKYHVARAWYGSHPHQYYREWRAAERRRVEWTLLGQHGRLRIKRSVFADSAWCGHFDQWSWRFRCHRQHAHREYRCHALYGSRPQRRLLLQSQRDLPLQHGTLGWPLGCPGPSELSSTAISCRAVTSPTIPW